MSGCTVQLPPDAPQSTWLGALSLATVWVVAGLILSTVVTLGGLAMILLPGPFGTPVAVALGIPVLNIFGLSLSGSLPLGLVLVIAGVVFYRLSRPKIGVSTGEQRCDQEDAKNKRRRKKA